MGDRAHSQSASESNLKMLSIREGAWRVHIWHTRVSGLIRHELGMNNAGMFFPRRNLAPPGLRRAGSHWLRAKV